MSLAATNERRMFSTAEALAENLKSDFAWLTPFVSFSKLYYTKHRLAINGETTKSLRFGMSLFDFLHYQQGGIAHEHQQPGSTFKACNPPSARWFPVVDPEKANGQRQENHNRQISRENVG